MKPNIITSAIIENTIAKKWGTRKFLIIPNVSYGWSIHECDLLICNKNKYCTEIEIKISVADFKKDFEKRHQHKDYYNRIKYFYYAVPHYIYEKIKDLVPDHAGLIVINETEDNRFKENPFYVQIKKEAPVIPKSRPISDKELVELQRLALMRMWDYKNQIIKLRNQYKNQSILV